MKIFRLLFPLLLLVVVNLALPFSASAQDALPFRNPKLPVSQRVDDLIGRLTTSEKISLMMMGSPAIPRLGIAGYYWWNEALHGVVHGNTTVFPQAIGLAATWDDDLHFQVATAISDEARALNNEGQFGLTCWAPNINIVRDPRWGRGQETYGEDPFLTSRMGVAFVKGMQGDDPTYLKTIATPKHFAVHSGPEPSRHHFNAIVSQHDLWDTYLPAFEACVREGKADSIMSAYSAINGTSATASKWLLTDVLRTQWGFSGCVVSDVDSVGDVTYGHHNADTLAAGDALALKSGLDLNSGGSFQALPQALAQGLITEEDIDAGLRHVLTARFRLGEFDPPECVPYRKIPVSTIESPAHDALALRAARESIVLLKNDGHVLPLPKTLNTVAVIGPNANDTGMQLGNYNGWPSHAQSVLEGIKSKLGKQTTVLTAKGCGITDEPTLVPASALTTDGTKSGLSGAYYPNRNLTGTPAATRTDRTINFNWSYKSPANGIPTTDFSVRWTGKITIPTDGAYALSTSTDDGARLYLDGKLVLDDWHEHGESMARSNQWLAAGSTHALRMEYFQGGGEAVAKLCWQRESSPDMYKKLTPRQEAAVAVARKADAVILVLGLSAGYEKEESPGFNVEGFSGGDRTAIELPARQQQLIHALEPLHKPMVVVVMSGSAVALTGLRPDIPIVQAWYPGEHGDAVADVLFGDYNPAGRLPVTIYRSTADLPPFTDYNMHGRTYRYFTGTPLYAFGHGLSYTTFVYSKLKVNKTALTPKDTVKVSVQVRNTGKRDGDEVVQLYLSYPKPAVPAPIRALKGFKRVSLKAGAVKTVEFTLTPYQLSLVDNAGARKVFPGRIAIHVGGDQTHGLSEIVKVTGNPTPASYAYQATVVR